MSLQALLMPHPQQIPPFVARDYLRRFRISGGWVIKRALATMMTAQEVTDNLLPQLKRPVLIIWGSLDQIAPVDQAQTMHHLIPQSQLLLIPGCGHMVPLQCSAEMDPTAPGIHPVITRLRTRNLDLLTPAHLLCETQPDVLHRKI